MGTFRLPVLVPALVLVLAACGGPSGTGGSPAPGTAPSSISTASVTVNPERTPDSGVRNVPFGAGGMITYLIVEHERRADILLVTWAGPAHLS